MNWDNHGEIWDINHIIPHRIFNIVHTFEYFACNRFRNLQTMMKDLNKAKKASYNID